jgi:heme A synthase
MRAVLRTRIPTHTTSVVPLAAYHSRVFLHDRYGFVLMLVAAVGALAAITGLARPRILPAVRVYLRVQIALVAIQVVIGLVLVATGDRPQQLIHWFYGAATLLSLPLAMTIGKRLGGREEQIWLAGGAVMTLLFALRALATG